MSKVLRASLVWLAVLGSAAAMAQDAAPPAPGAAAPATVEVILHTVRGDVRVALEVQRAPLTVANFLRYVDDRRFDGITFYRAVKVTDDGKYGLVQGGLDDPKKLFPPIAHESPAATRLSNVDGAISMAREAPGTATADFFFVLGDLPSLDGDPAKTDDGYAVFGRVTAGIEVLRGMLDLPRSAEARSEVMKGQMLREPVKNSPCGGRRRRCGHGGRSGCGPRCRRVARLQVEGARTHRKILVARLAYRHVAVASRARNDCHHPSPVAAENWPMARHVSPWRANPWPNPAAPMSTNSSPPSPSRSTKSPTGASSSPPISILRKGHE